MSRHSNGVTLASEVFMPVPTVEFHAWMSDAKCSPETAHLFFGGEAAKAQARMICRDCPVARQCRDLGKGEREGVWGGKAKSDPTDRVPGYCVDCGGPVLGQARRCPECQADHRRRQHREYSQARRDRAKENRMEAMK